MTQVAEKKRPPLKWVVPIPTNEKGSFGRPSLCAACRGNDVMAVILNYFVYEASTEAEQKKIDTLKVQSIQLIRTHDQILEGCKPSRVSKKTLIDYMRKLEAWGFLKVDGYHHVYEVCFPSITEAMKTPPPTEKRKPRGRHVSQKVKSTNLQSSEVESTKVEDCTLGQMSNLKSEMLALQFEMSNLKSEMLALQFEMSKLTFQQSSECAPQLVLTPLFESSRLIDCNRLLQTIEITSTATAIADGCTHTFLDAGSQDRDLLTRSEQLSTGDVDNEEVPEQFHEEASTIPLSNVTTADNAPDAFQPGNGTAESRQGATGFSEPLEALQTEQAIDLIAELTIEKPKIPVMPLVAMRWCGEKAVQIVECKLGKYYLEKTREKQIKAGNKIVKEGYTEQQFIDGYEERDDPWWHEHKGLLHVVDLAANTERRQMRLFEVLDKLEARRRNSHPVKTDRTNARNTTRVVANGEERIVEWEGVSMPISEARTLGWTGFEKYVGNGPDALEEMKRAVAELEASGELARLGLEDIA